MARHPNQKSPIMSAPRYVRKKPEERPELQRERDLKALVVAQQGRPMKPPGRR